MAEERDPKTRYSYEEMVARLRESRPEGSRVKSEEKEVDPETGKVTIRRQKKRRTSSGKTSLVKSPSGQKFLQRLVLFGAPSLGLVALAAYLVAMAAVSTTRFQTGLGESLGKEFGLPNPVAVDEVKLVGLTLKAKMAAMDGPATGLLRSAEGSDIEMLLDPRSFLGGDWTVDVCKVSNANLRLANPPSVRTTSLAPNGAVLVPAGFLLSETPSRIHFHDVTLEQMNLLFGAGDPEKGPGLKRVRASLVRRGKPDGGTYYDAQISGGREGTLVLPGWPPLKVESMRAEVRKDQATIKRSVLHFAKDGPGKAKEGVSSTVEAHGTIPFTAGKSAAIDLVASGILLSDLLPKTAQQNFSGIFRSEGLRFTYDASDPSGSWRLQGPVVIEIARLKGLRVFNLLQTITGGEITAFDFEDCQFVLDMSPAGTRLNEIRASVLGRAHVTGQLAISPRGELDGSLRLGLAHETLLENFPGFFKAGEEACHWTSVKMSGTASSPGEDLSARLRAWLSSQPGGTANPRIKPLELPEEDPESGELNPPPDRGNENERLEGLFGELLGDQPGEKSPSP